MWTLDGNWIGDLCFEFQDNSRSSDWSSYLSILSTNALTFKKSRLSPSSVVSAATIVRYHVHNFRVVTAKFIAKFIR